MFIPRVLEIKLRSAVKKFPVLAIVGPRQSGKTTLAQYVFSNYQYISLEDLDNRSFADDDPRGFLETYKNRVILDEAQKVPKLFSYLQTQIDKSNRPGQYILTGSQNFLLHQNISQTLAGRVALFKLLPLSILELKNAGIVYNKVEDYIFKGGYPRIYSAKINPLDWYPNYIETYIERDVRNIKEITNLSSFRNFVKLCAGRIGQLLNLSDLARDCGISHNTARSWISILEASFVIFLLPPYFKNFNKRIVKTPKLYFYDTGLACFLLGITKLDQINTHYLKGSLFENFIIDEFIKKKYSQGLNEDYYFWRDKIGHEIDLLLDNKKELNPVEIKSGKTISPDFFSGITYWKKLTGKKVIGRIIYGGTENQKRENVAVISWNKLN